MSSGFLTATLLLAYGPFALIAFLYLVGLLLRLAGRPRLLATLIRRTKMPEPIVRADSDHEP